MENIPDKEDIMIYVDCSPTTGFAEMAELKLPQKESWYQIQKILRTSVDIHVAGEGYEFKQRTGGKWKYQLLSHDRKKVINRSAVYLITDEDYATLVKKVKGEGLDTPFAVLTQEEAEAVTVPKNSSGERQPENSRVEDSGGDGAGYDSGRTNTDDDVEWYEGPITEPVDEDGNPYLDPYDPEEMKRVIIKYALDNPGPIE